MGLTQMVLASSFEATAFKATWLWMEQLTTIKLPVNKMFSHKFQQILSLLIGWISAGRAFGLSFAPGEGYSLRGYIVSSSPS